MSADWHLSDFDLWAAIIWGEAFAEVQTYRGRLHLSEDLSNFPTSIS